MMGYYCISPRRLIGGTMGHYISYVFELLVFSSFNHPTAIISVF